jgi:hypothetical protein
MSHLAPGDLVMVRQLPPDQRPVVDFSNTPPGLVGIVLSGEYTAVRFGEFAWCTVHDVRFPAFTQHVATPCLRKLRPPPNELEHLGNESLTAEDLFGVGA